MPTQDAYTFTVRAGTTCDSYDAFRDYTIRVLAIKDFSFPVRTGVVGRGYSHSFSAWGLAAGSAAAWTATGLPPGLSMAITGQITGIPTTVGTYPGTVTVSAESGARTSTRAMTIEILPELAFVNPATLPPATVGVPYSVTIQTIGGYPPVTVYSNPPTAALGLSYNESTRTISGTPTGAGTYTLQLYAYDANEGGGTSRTFTVVVYSPPVMMPATAPDTSIGSAYNLPLTVPNAPCTAWDWSVLTGTLPPGLSVSGVATAAGAIVGTAGMPSQDTYTFTVRARSTCATPDAIRSYTIRVLAIKDSSFPVPSGVVGRSYSHAFSAWGINPSASATWSATGLPPGLSMSVSGQITGVPTTAGTFAGAVTVSADNGTRSATRSMSIVILPELAFVTPATLPAATVGVPYSVAIQTIGGYPPVTVYSTPPTAALGLSYDQTTRTISGTPTASGTYTLLLSAYDANEGGGTSRTFTAVVHPAPAVMPTTAPDTSIGSMYNVPLTVANGQCTTWDWSVLTGTLPPGLSVNPVTAAASAIAGTAGMPSQDAYTFTVRARSTCASPDAAQGYTIRVLAIKDSSFPVPSGAVGQSYSHAFSAWGINPSASAAWSATGLPPGLSMSVSGQITGIPTTVGTYAGAVTVSAENGARTATRAVSIVIATALTFVTPAAHTATIGVPFSLTIQTSGGTLPVTISSEVATVAYGLSYNRDTATISGTPAGPGTYTIALFARDAGSQHADRTFNVVISAPTASITTESLPGGSVQVSYSTAMTSSGFLTAPTWSAAGLPPGLALNPATGVISGTPTLNGAFGVTFSASTSTQVAVPKTLVIAIGQPALDFSPGALTAGVVGVSYSAAFTATGGDGKYIFSPVGGGLPPGMSLSPSGAVSGIPTQAGDFNFAVRVTSAQLVTEKSVSMTIDAASMELTPSALASVYVGDVYSQTLVASGGSTPYVFQFGPNSNVPPGLALSATGVLAGTPTAAGTFQFSIDISDAKQRRLQRDYTLIVLAPGTITTPGLPPATQNEPYKAVIETQGGTGPFTYQVAVGTLPTGLTLNPNGEISGTPTTPGSFQFTVQSTDANGRKTAHEFFLKVFELVLLGPDSLPSVTLLADYSAQVVASGGQPPFVWRISNGTLPDGILFTDGAFRGAATRAGTFTFDVTVTDQRERSATKRYSIAVASGPSIEISGAPLPDGVVGVQYSAAFEIKGGRAPFRWSFTGQLPTGLNLNGATGTISGVPTAAGVFDFVLRVEDADGLSGTTPLRITAGLGPVPPATITGVSGTSGPNNQIQIGVTLSAPFPAPLDGALTLTFRPDTGADDPAVLFSNGSRLIPFTVPTGSTRANFPAGNAALQTGTVAGLITMTGSLRLNGIDVTPAPAPVSTVRIDPGPPVITRMETARTSTGFEVTIFGFTTARQVTQARVTLTAGSGFTLAGTQFTVELGTLFSSYYASTGSVPFGSQFRLVLPFTLSDPLAVSAISVTLVNAQGSSAPSSATF